MQQIATSPPWNLSAYNFKSEKSTIRSSNFEWLNSNGFRFKAIILSNLSFSQKILKSCFPVSPDDPKIKQVLSYVDEEVAIFFTSLLLCLPKNQFTISVYLHFQQIRKFITCTQYSKNSKKVKSGEFTFLLPQTKARFWKKMFRTKWPRRCQRTYSRPENFKKSR